MAKTPEQRFWAKVQKTDGCWLWTAAKAAGYGRIQRDGKLVGTHRLSWELHNGTIPEGLNVLHECDIRACVNPNHLFLGTNADNSLDRDEKGRHGRAKLTVIQALDIRSRQGQSQTRLAEEFGVSQTQISRVRSGKSRAHKHGIIQG